MSPPPIRRRVSQHALLNAWRARRQRPDDGRGEYGMATLELDPASDALFAGLAGRQQVWMSHRDAVAGLPEGFSTAGRTATCAIAAIAAPGRKLYAVQFHPEVVHTERGREYLANFVFRVCGCRKDWDPRGRVPRSEEA